MRAKFMIYLEMPPSEDPLVAATAFGWENETDSGYFIHSGVGKKILK